MKKTFLSLLILLLCGSVFAQESRRVKLLFAGDAMQHQSQIDAAKTPDGYDYSSYFGLIRNRIDSADIAIVNLEVTLAGKPYTGYPTFSAPDEFAAELKKTGFDVFLTANNHVLDKGRKGLERTIAQLDTLDVKHLGSYINSHQRNLLYPLMLLKNGIRMALLNYTYDTNGIKVQYPNIVNYIQKDSILSDIRKAKQLNPDIIIANMHWGLEYKLTHNYEQKKLADLLIENGVNLVIGSHPHVVQPIDVRKKGDSIKNVIVYSLGNFVSGMKAPNTDGGLLVNIDLSKDEKGIVRIDSCYHSLVWVHKQGIKPQIQLVPVEEYEDETAGKTFLGETAYNKMMQFARAARIAIKGD
ncbi:MAG: CapA family protein [Prevotella sp.]|jgi:poly-gamma-glutamate synthesis protein (capsule biosynthesis protein)|nr:CapA family protein [Prevotella sp.]